VQKCYGYGCYLRAANYEEWWDDRHVNGRIKPLKGWFIKEFLHHLRELLSKWKIYNGNLLPKLPLHLIRDVADSVRMLARIARIKMDASR
jgi:hypothetical protein